MPDDQMKLFGEAKSKRSPARKPAKKISKQKKSRGGTTRKAGKPKLRREFSAGFILFRDSSEGPLYLLLDYGKHWDYAKGHLEEDENAWQAAVRELREETGIRQVDRVTSFRQDMHYFFYSPRKGRVSKTVTYFLGRTRSEEVTLSDEHAGYAWLPFEDAMKKLTYDNARDLLRAAQEALQRT